MSKPVGENTVAFHTGEVGHCLVTVRKGGGRDQPLKMEATRSSEMLTTRKVTSM